MKLKKSMVVTAYLLPVALLALASSLSAVTVEATGVAVAQYTLQSFTAISILWLLILAGCLAIIASSPRISRFIIIVIALLATFEFVSIISKLLSFPDWLSDSIFSEEDEAYMHLAPWVLALLGLSLSIAISFLALRSSKNWQATRKYDRAQAPSANPWAAIDHGVDPTLD